MVASRRLSEILRFAVRWAKSLGASAIEGAFELVAARCSRPVASIRMPPTWAEAVGMPSSIAVIAATVVMSEMRAISESVTDEAEAGTIVGRRRVCHDGGVRISDRSEGRSEENRPRETTMLQPASRAASSRS